MTGPTSVAAFELDGVFNFRDLGGLPLAGGGTTTGGRLFRSDGIHRAPADQQARLHEMSVRVVVDLRTDAEIEREGRFEADGIAWRHAPIIQSLADFVGGAEDRPAAPGRGEDHDLLRHHFEHMVASNADALAAALVTVADSLEVGPTVFHCTAGKDRTGVVAALILAASGVADDDIAEDFARSAAAVTRMVGWYRANTGTVPADRMAEMGIDPALAPVLMGAEAATMAAFLDRLRATSGGIEPYLASIGADAAVRRITLALRG